MHIIRCRITLLEKTFFSSREVSNFYYTEPLLGNYALAYAMGLCQAPYYNDGTLYYQEHLTALNEQGIYVTPATIREAPRFFVEQFNAQPESYWFAMGAGVLVTRPDGTQMQQSGKVWYVKPAGGRRKKVNAANRPQFGRIRYLAIGNVATCYILSREPFTPPSYVRLGKFMSKARLEYQTLSHSETTLEQAALPYLLNPADLGDQISLHLYDLITVPPTPLIKNSRLSGPGYRLQDGTLLPAGMRFGVEQA